MSDLGHHGEWLSLIDVSGPFLAEPVLKDAFPQGLEGLDSAKKIMVRQAYDEWREALDLDDPDFQKIHSAWLGLILKQVLEFDENGTGDILKSADKIPSDVRYESPEHGITLRPDYALISNQPSARPLILISVFSPEISLTDPLKGDGWAASPAERMVELCRATEVRLGLVSNGEQWMLIDAPIGAVTTFASWYARLWGQEPITLQAFVNLLGVRRFFVDKAEQLPALLDESLTHQDEVTEALGGQVRRAVEVLIQALDRADVDRNRELLDGIEPAEIYEAGLTVMMRIVFLLCAEERGLLLLDDGRYQTNYAVSTLRMQLRSESEEILERRWDAWSRLLSIFRAVFGGVDHEAMRLPALGGSLFDPDRFPFLEGRKKGSRWKFDPATPLPIDNRTVLYLLDAVQLFQGRTLSYLALDIEQIGYVYEGLLERTVIRAKEATLDLDATKNAENPWVSLPELDDASANGRSAVEELLKDRTKSSASRVRNELDETVDESSADKLLTACHADRSLRDRIRPYFHLLRTDRWGYPIVYPKNAFMVTSGTDRRETGTHYTPKSFTEAIVKETLEPLVYIGPAEGKPREHWELKSPAEMLDLKICDPAMGSGAFLVQVCRWLSERLVEAWAQAERQGRHVTSEGEVVAAIGSREPLRLGIEERLLTARRLIAERSLYGVDMNPLAVELAKLSIWLVTLAKGRPFGFLDHNLRCGDSLFGLQSLEQLYFLDLKPGKGSSKRLFASKIDRAIEEAIALRSDLRIRPIHDIRDVQVMAGLDAEARRKLKLPELIADAFLGEIFAAGGKAADITALSIEAGDAAEGDNTSVEALARSATKGLGAGTSDGRPSMRPLHWPLEFPEVFSRPNGGFDAILGNPPFLGGKRISSALGKRYEKYLKRALTSKKGAADLCAYFFLRANSLCREGGCFGFLATKTISQTDTREIGLATLVAHANIYSCKSSVKWPGKAAVNVAVIHFFKGGWSGQRVLNGKDVKSINSFLLDTEVQPTAKTLVENKTNFFGTKGTYVHGTGFVLSEEQAQVYLGAEARNSEILKRYLVAKDFTTHPQQEPSRWVIDFGERTEEEARLYPGLFLHVERTVKPEREKLVGQIHEKCFWKFWDKRQELYDKISALDAVIVCPEVSKYSVFSLLPNSYLFSSMVNVIASDSPALLACLQSNIHGAWAWSQGSTLVERLRYTTSDCLDTFPFPTSVASLLTVGEQLHSCRSKIMTSTSQGLTKIYNRLHDPSDVSSDIQEFREICEALDRAVIESYGWSDLELGHGFYETKQGTRFTIGNTTTESIISRLLALNQERFKNRQIKFEVDDKPGLKCASDDLFGLDDNSRTRKSGRSA